MGERASIPTSQRKLELLRRILLGGLLFAACTATFFQRKKVLTVQALDFDEQYRQTKPALSRSAFIEQEIRKVDASPAQKSTEDWERLASRAGRHSIYFDPADSMFAGLLDKHPRRVVLVKMGATDIALDVASGTSLYGADWSFAHPYHLHGIWLTALALIGYVAVRWRGGANEARYQAYVPMVADAVGTFFFVGGVGIAQNTKGAGAFAGWLLALVGLAFLLWGASYASLRLQCVSDGLRIVTLFATRDCSFDALRGASIRPKLPVFRQIGQSESPYFELSLLDGFSVGMWVESSRGVDECVAHLSRGGVKVDVLTHY